MIRDLAKFRSTLHSSAKNYDNTAHLTTFDIDLPWISVECGEEWICTDLGTVSSVSEVAVCWAEDFAEQYDILFSDDAVTWHTAASVVGAADTCVKTKVNGTARYVKVLCKVCSGTEYAIRHLSVFGENDLTYVLDPMPAPNADGTQPLTGGNWKIIRASQIEEDGTCLASPKYDDDAWMPATVPGTALVSYLRAGAVPDPDFDDNQFQISEAYFTADFWYRNRFVIPTEKQGQRIYLNFDAINWKADVYFNGVLLENPVKGRKHSIEGAFIRTKFDITALAKTGEENYLAVYIYKNDNPGEVTTQGLAYGPGPNGGLLGGDNPTIHASVGWDWLPTIRGRNIGIYGDVYLSYSGAVELVDPWIDPKLTLISESAANPAEDLMLGENVKMIGIDGALEDWRGKTGDSFVVDLGKNDTLGAITFVWGSEAGGPAADADSRHPELFSLESSENGTDWVNFDAYPGGEMEMRWFGMVKLEAREGTPAFEAHAGSDSVQGSTASHTVNFGNRGPREFRFFAPQKARYFRFTVTKQRELNGKPVDTRINEIRAYAQSPEQVEQGMKHSYEIDFSHADLHLHTELHNRSDAPVTVELRASVTPGDVSFRETYTVQPGETLPTKLTSVLENPHLWWPNTYGEQFLYTASVEVVVDGKISDTKTFRFGVRRFDYPIDGGLLTLYCNGTRILCKGGNWGLDDGLKRDTAKVLDDKVRLHKEANMTMIRNWVGMTCHPGFYEACDKYGVLIWDDFWLANPFDGPEPHDPDMFLENAEDKIKAIRSHASLALYCGRNEGNPNEILNPALAELTGKFDGTRIYVPHSAAAPVGSGGGYSLAKPDETHGVKQYFNDVSSTVIRSERGVPNVPNLESLKRFLRPENLWPINESWALHDWTYHMNGPANTYMQTINIYLDSDVEVPVDRVQGSAPKDEDPVYQAYKAAIAEMCAISGEKWTLEDFSRAAQMINYDSHRGMFDALAARRANGLLMWMSQSSWPSFMWQTYDFYLDTNGGYFGTKAGNQPTRPVFDPRDNSILLANAAPKSYENVTTTVEIYDLCGRKVSEQTFTTELLEADAYGEVITTADFSASTTDIVFLRVVLTDGEGNVLGRNTYWHNRKTYSDYRALNTMEKANASLSVLSVEETEDGQLRYTLQVANSGAPALGVRVRLTDADGNAVLPVFYSDNYLMMMPNETAVITAEFDADRLTGDPAWSLSGWNL